MKNLLDNVNVGIIFLDRHLIIRRFTREAVRIYPLVATDVGRPLANIKSSVEMPDLLVAAQNVLDTLVSYEQEIHIDSDTWILIRIQPYSTLELKHNKMIPFVVSLSNHIHTSTGSVRTVLQSI